jgi:hypothetical protein
MTRTSSRPFAFSAAATPVATAGALPNSEWIHGSCGDAGRDGRRVAEQRVDPRKLPRALGIGRGEDLQAACRVGRDQATAAGPHGRVERVASTERLSAALTGAMPARQRVGTAGVRLDGAKLRIEQAAADGKAARLEELDLAAGHQTGPAATAPI